MEESTKSNFTHELKNDEPYYLKGPQQKHPSEGTFPAGTKVRLDEKGGSYSLVTSETGITAHVSSGSLSELPDDRENGS